MAVMWIRIDCIRIRIDKILSIRIQVNKITKFSKRLLIFKTKIKTFNYQHFFFLGSNLKNIISCEKKKLLLVKLLPFSFILSVIFKPLDPNPDLESGSGSGSTDPIESGSGST